MIPAADIYPQPNVPDPVLEAKYVLTLVRRHVPAVAVREVDESGGEARAYLVDDDKVLKVQRPHRLRDRTSLEKEVFFLNELASYPEISVPRVLGYGREGDVEYICMTRMHGVAARHLDLERDERRRVLRALGRALRQLHGVGQEALRQSPLFPGDRSQEDFRGRLIRGFDQAVAAVHADGVWGLPVPPEALAERVMSTLPVASTLVALHSNPGPEHVFVDPVTKEFTGLIDFGDAYISHPAFDIRWPRRDDRLAILDGYRAEAPVNDGFLVAWRAVQVLSDMAALTSPRFGAERRAQARENLTAMLREG
ncbi:MAG TPA: aminoglycoside phosphotransferase family protein [Dehalococcoidia bacterium]|nr:aminoglycoside phosphotransferase family protein [Dehalococcoidia bacterium]